MSHLVDTINRVCCNFHFKLRVHERLLNITKNRGLDKESFKKSTLYITNLNAVM